MGRGMSDDQLCAYTQQLLFLRADGLTYKKHRCT